MHHGICLRTALQIKSSCESRFFFTGVLRIACLKSRVFVVWSLEGGFLCTMPCNDLGGRTRILKLARLAVNEQVLPLGAARPPSQQQGVEGAVGQLGCVNPFIAQPPLEGDKWPH